MRHGKAHRKLERPIGHRRALLRHLVTSLIKHERIETTLPKAKELRRFADRMITFAKKGTLHARRQAARFVMMDPEVLQKLFSELAPRFKDRAGGYTRIIHLGFRHGDAAPMALIEYLGYQPKTAEEKPEKKKKEKVEKKVQKPVKPRTEKPKSGKSKEKKPEPRKGFFSRLTKDKKGTKEKG